MKHNEVCGCDNSVGVWGQALFELYEICGFLLLGNARLILCWEVIKRGNSGFG